MGVYYGMNGLWVPVGGQGGAALIDPNLLAENIKSGVTISGVMGTFTNDGTAKERLWKKRYFRFVVMLRLIPGILFLRFGHYLKSVGNRAIRQSLHFLRVRRISSGARSFKMNIRCIFFR